MLRKRGRQVHLFDATIYEDLSRGIDSDKQESENLNARPFDDSLFKQALHGFPTAEIRG